MRRLLLLIPLLSAAVMLLAQGVTVLPKTTILPKTTVFTGVVPSISLANAGSSHNCAPATTCQTTITSSTSGNLLWGEFCTTTNQTLTSIIDSQSQTWTTIDSTVINSSNARCVTAYFPNTLAGVTSVTVTWGGSSPTAVIVHEAHGVTTLDQHQLWTASGPSPWASPTVTTTTANEILFGGNYNGNSNTVTFAGTGSWNSALTQGEAFNGVTIFSEYQIVSGIQTNIAATGTSSAGSNIPTIATFK